ncbi:MAG: efflux RND transporter periplasmic adaptor subunit [Roseiflexaceae bacterium]|nr:efflux RND transporter periplasmic adaptor subunit [Roseiflexaceae bacterium]
MTKQRSRIPARTILTIAGLLALVGAVAVGLGAFRPTSTAARRSYELVAPRRSSIIATVNATGQMQPARTANLSFVSPNRVAEVLVQVGEAVQADQPIARLDTREQQIRVAQAAAQVAQAQASYEKLNAGASVAERAAAEAQLAQAQAQAQQTRGSVTTADLQAAEAQLAQAREQLRILEAGPNADDLRASEAQLQQTQAQLATQRDQLSAAKTNAEFQVGQAVNTLTQAQSRAASAASNWQYVQDTGLDPLRPSLGVDARGGDIANQLNEAQRQQYADASVQAEAALNSAEQAVTQATVVAETARQNEINGIQAAEQTVAQTQARLDQLRGGADAGQIAAARAQLASARANLAKLQGEQRGGALQAAQAGVDQARANQERVDGAASTSDLAVAQAQLQSAQASLDLAELALDEATLSAPFSGTIAELNLKPGELPSATRAPVVLADLSSFYVDVAVDEIDVSRITAGQPVTLTLDALPDVAIAATVERIAPLASAQSAVTAYQVRVSAPRSDPRVRPGMSTTADIIVAEQQNVLLVPRRAVRNDRGRLIVETPTDPAVCQLPPEQRPERPELRQIDVRTGLSNEVVIQITEGLDESSCVYVEGVDSRFDLFGGPPQAR